MNDSPHDPGAALKAAREAIRVTPREVADELNLPVHVVEAIENNDTENLPAAVYARGYIRAYAKLLELDPEPIVVGYEFSEPLPKPAPEGRFEKVQPVFNRQQILVLVGGAILAIAVLGVLVAWLWPEDDEVRPVAEVPVVANPVVRPSEPVAEAPPPPISEAPDLGDPIDEPLVIDPAPEPFAGVTDGRRITEFGSDEMWFQFTEDCWVEIKDTDGVNLYSDLSRAGQTLRLVGEGPFRILLGYAPGVEMEYNGERVALTAHTRNNVAALVLGQ